MEKGQLSGNRLLYLAGLTLLFVLAFSYIFNEKLDMNGDNCTYYMLSTSIAEGHGYADITNAAHNPSNVFPPGYPLLMSVIRFFTDSFFPQKVLNGLFLLGSALLLFLFVERRGVSRPLAFVASAAVLVNYQVLHFATMMMSETSFLFTSVLACWFLYKADESERPFWCEPFFYLAIVTAAFNYHIRTQGIALIAAILCYLLLTKRWKETLAFAGGYAVCLLPWMLRNKLQGLEQSRYIDMIASSNHWRPEEGTLDLGGIIGRFFETFQMLLTKAIPNSILPYMDVNYDTATTAGEWIMAILLFGLIGIGMWRLGRYKWLFMAYTVATFGVISLFSTPSGNRYTTPLLPFLEVSLLIGLWVAISWALKRFTPIKGFSPWLLLLVIAGFAYPQLELLHRMNKMPYPPNYQNFFTIAKEVRKRLPANTVVCSRKPELFYMYSKTAVTMYSWTEDQAQLIRDMVEAKVDYVVLDQLGFSSTPRYLFPAIENNPELFPVMIHLKNPDTYLLRFEREKAQAKFGNKQ